MLESSQSTLIKNNLGLSKFARSGLLLDAISIDRLESTYFKHKFTFLRQVRSNVITLEIFNYTKNLGKNSCKLWYFGQINSLNT